ncbi:MAG TPA: polysaccharide deacetylase family protein [Gemmatimonadaceae bacterium]|nr:polysaccharide deacetylase family protein [Gemmatimonadaceae bacterium]
MKAILTYHSIDDSSSVISISPDVFRRHVAWLASGAVRVVSLDELMALPSSVDAVSLTFDDAFVNFAEIAAPLLVRNRLPATVMVVSEHAGGTNAWRGACAHDIPTLPLMDWHELGRMREMGFAIGAHSRTHPHLTALPPDALADEIGGSAEHIERELGVRPAVFAYPYGSVDEAVAEATSGFSWGLTTELRTLRGRERRTCLPRLDMYYFRAGTWLEAYGLPRFRQYLWVRSGARRVRAALATVAE